MQIEGAPSQRLLRQPVFALSALIRSIPAALKTKLSMLLAMVVVFAGMLVGAYSWGIVSDKHGRRCFLSFSC